MTASAPPAPAARPAPRRHPAGSDGDVAVVVVTHRSQDDVEACLDSLRRASRGLSTAVVVVDSASDDATCDVVRRAAPQASLVACDTNVGFARGCHLGAAASRSDFLLFVNPDAVLDEDCLHAALACAGRHPDAAVIGGSSLDSTGTPDHRSVWGAPSLWSLACFALGLSSALSRSKLFDPEGSAGPVVQEGDVPVVSGAMMLIRRQAWDELGGFDQRYLLYGEDVDLCLRARRRGWRVVATPHAKFRHSGGASSSALQKALLLHRGKATVVATHLPRGQRALGAHLLVTGVGVRAGASKLLQASRGHRDGRHGPWIELWRQRAAWRDGWLHRSNDALHQTEVAR